MRWTLCLLCRADEVLLLRRNNPPGQGMWNGVGGKLEVGESPLAACAREVVEETGYEPLDLAAAGVMSWDSFRAPDEGIYLFVGRAPEGEPDACDEGELRWWPIQEVERSGDVVPWVRAMLGHLLAREEAVRHHFDFAADGRITAHHRLPLEPLL